MADEPRKQVRVQISVSSGTPTPPAQGANFFHFTRVGAEYQMLVGTVNLLALHEAKDVPVRDGDLRTVTPVVTHRFLLSPIGFANLREALNAVAEERAMRTVEIGDGGQP